MPLCKNERIQKIDHGNVNIKKYRNLKILKVLKKFAPEFETK